MKSRKRTLSHAMLVTCSHPKREMQIILSYECQLTPRALAFTWPLLLSPWANMEGAVSILGPSSVAGTGIPCTECHTQHRGGCSFHDLLLTDIATLKLYAETLVPPGPEFHSLRGALYTLMGTIHGNLARGGVTPEKLRGLRAGVLSVKEQCNLYVP